MPLGYLKDIVDQCPSNIALLGLDVGKKTIGLALSNPDQSVATPLQTIRRKKFSRDMELLGDVIKDYNVRGFIIGLPVNMDGSEGPRAQSIKDFAAEMALRTQIVGEDAFIGFWDERLSTVSVESFVDEFVDKRKTKAQSKSSGLIDKLAAHVILQGALDYIQDVRRP